MAVHRKYLMINLHESYVAELGFELTTPETAVRSTDTAFFFSNPNIFIFFFYFSMENEVLYGGVYDGYSGFFLISP